MHTHARTHVDKDMPRRHAVIVLTLLPGQTCQCRGFFGPRKGGIENIYLYRLRMLVRTHLSQSKNDHPLHPYQRQSEDTLPCFTTNNIYKSMRLCALTELFSNLNVVTFQTSL